MIKQFGYFKSIYKEEKLINQ